MASMDEAQYERFVAFNNARLNNRSLKKARPLRGWQRANGNLLGTWAGRAAATHERAPMPRSVRPPARHPAPRYVPPPPPRAPQLVATLTRTDKVDPLLLLALGSITKAFRGELVEAGGVQTPGEGAGAGRGGARAVHGGARAGLGGAVVSGWCNGLPRGPCDAALTGAANCVRLGSSSSARPPPSHTLHRLPRSSRHRGAPRPPRRAAAGPHPAGLCAARAGRAHAA